MKDKLDLLIKNVERGMGYCSDRGVNYLHEAVDVAKELRAAVPKPLFAKETLTQLDPLPTDPPIMRCACCGGPASLWEVDREGTVTKMVNCDTAELIPEVDGGFALLENCPLYSTPMTFNKATRREAINYWNKFNTRLVILRGPDPVRDALPPLLSAVKEVIRISDRKHIAWDAAKAAITTIEEQLT